MRRLLVAAGLLALAPPCALAEVRLCITAFDGPGAIGQQVATVLNLQVFQTLRKAPWPNPERLAFGDGTIVWSDVPLAEPSFEAAEKLAGENACQLVLWGSARPFGNGVVVQASLSLLGLDHDQERLWWSEEGEISLGFPRERFEFAPIVLTAEVVRQFTPDAIPILAARGSTEVRGRLGPRFRALRFEGDWIELAEPVPHGWVSLPRLSRERSEVVDFAGGLLRLLRGDWDGARLLLEPVAVLPHAPTAIKVDAHLLCAAAAQRRGQSSAEHLRRAAELNPYAESVIRCQAMAELLSLERSRRAAVSRSPGQLGEVRDRIDLLLGSRSRAIPEGDPWSARVRSAAARIAGSPPP